MQQTWIGIFFSVYFAFLGLYSAFLGPYLQFMGHSLNVIAVALGLMHAMRVVGPFFWAWISDHTSNNVRWIKVGAFGGFVFCVLTFACEQSPGLMLAMLVLLNLTVSGLTPMSDAHVLNVGQGCIGQYGKVRLWGSFGFVSSVVACGFWSETHGLNDYFWFLSGSLALAWLCALQFKNPVSLSVERSESQKLPFAKIFAIFCRTKSMRVFWVSSFFMVFAHGIFYTFFSLYLIEYEYSKSNIGIFWAVGVLFEIAFFALQSKFFKRLSLMNWLCVSFAACGLRFWMLAMAPQSQIVIFASQALHCLTFAAHHTAAISWLRLMLPAHMNARGQAVYTMVAYGLGGGLGALAGGFVWQLANPSGVFLLASVAGFVALWFGLKLRATQMLSV